MKQKIISLISIISVCFLLSACGSTGKVTNKDIEETKQERLRARFDKH